MIDWWCVWSRSGGPGWPRSAVQKARQHPLNCDDADYPEVRQAQVGIVKPCWAVRSNRDWFDGRNLVPGLGSFGPIRESGETVTEMAYVARSGALSVVGCRYCHRSRTKFDKDGPASDHRVLDRMLL